jgi:hypothetical protein
LAGTDLVVELVKSAVAGTVLSQRSRLNVLNYTPYEGTFEIAMKTLALDNQTCFPTVRTFTLGLDAPLGENRIQERSGDLRVERAREHPGTPGPG